EVVALGFQGVEAFVLDLPARPAAGGQFDDGVAADGQIGDEAVAIGHRAGGGANLDHQPVERHGIRAVAHRHIAKPAIGVGEALAAMLTRCVSSGSSTPVKYSSMVGWDDGLQTNRKCPPAAPTAWQIGWRE